MNIHRIVYMCLVLALLLTACSDKATPAPVTEAPGGVTSESPTATADPPTPTAAPTVTTEPAEEEPEPTLTLEPTTLPSYDGFLLEDVGFDTPESVLYDAEADVYLVANINGSPGAKDGNGFISRVSPEGELIALKWIDGAADGVTLNAPKGMVLTPAGLYVADLDTVKLFDRDTGTPLNDYPVPGAVFLNDLTADESGTVYVSGTSSGGVYIISPDGTVGDLMPAGSVNGPNGLAVWEGTVYVTSGNEVFAIMDGVLAQAFTVPKGALDGLVFLDSDNILVSSWIAEAVYHVDAEGNAVKVVSGVPGPADIGFDPERGYILIPLFDDNILDVRPLH